LGKTMTEFFAVGNTDVGLKRSNNEDAFLVRPQLGFCLVADGMGGAAAGEIASQIFSDTALEIFSGSPAASMEEMMSKVQGAFGLAHERVQAHIGNNPSHNGMGCTAELRAFSGMDFVIGHIGDSRTYRFANGRLKQLTKDHSLVQQQIDQGLITPEEARNHANRNIILRALGVEEEVALDIVTGKASPGDLFLLCSDGLTDMVTDDSILDTLASASPTADRTDRLISLAKEAGGLDNITVVLAEAV
jgi:protein phosphatase